MSIQILRISSLIIVMNITTAVAIMNISRQSKRIAWYKPDWCYPKISNEAKELLQQCIKQPPVELSGDINECIRRSKAFPIPFPIQTVRLQNLISRRPAQKLSRNIISTYPVIHERVLILMLHFLNYKREFGSDIEKVFYKNMTVPQLVDRILKKRAVTFMNSFDKYLLLSGENGVNGWELVGTPAEQPPLVLENCLSYDEMKISAMVFVSGYTECINDGARHNQGVVQEDIAQDEAIIIGVIGPRFEREGRMDREDILITKEQNTDDNGYGPVRSDSAIHQWRRIWSEFYQVSYRTYDELTSSVNIQYIDDITERYLTVGPEVIFDNEVYYKRLAILAETVLMEAQARGCDAGRNVYLNVIGAGLGVWKVSAHQTDVYVLTFVERTRALLERGLLGHVTDVNFAYIRPGTNVTELFKNSVEDGASLSEAKRMFLECGKHPKGGINVQLERREPSARLSGEHSGKLLVITYPWDGNAHPGNEFWLGSLSGSGDPAAACSTQVSELHNAHINLALSGLNVRVAGRTGLSTLPDCCLALTA